MPTLRYELVSPICTREIIESCKRIKFHAFRATRIFTFNVLRIVHDLFKNQTEVNNEGRFYTLTLFLFDGYPAHRKPKYTLFVCLPLFHHIIVIATHRLVIRGRYYSVFNYRVGKYT